MIIIRKFNENNAEQESCLIRNALVGVNSKDYPDSVIQFLYDNHSPERMIELSEEREFLVAEKDFIVIGTATLINDYIGSVFIDPKYHYKGINTKLMNAIECLAREKKIKKVKLAASITALNFYKKLEYKKKKKQDSGPHGITCIMTKKLK